jgi:8-oxo-dGTP pyrophosphatase MutT (NUDIX family)
LITDEAKPDPQSMPNSKETGPDQPEERKDPLPIGEQQPFRRGVVAVIVNDNRLLVIRRSQRVVAPGAFCFPGGAIESGESEAAALIREIQEELGVCVRPLRPLWRSVTSWNVHLAWWLAEPASGDCAWTPNVEEVESIHWLAPAEIQALPGLLESNHQFLRALATGEIELESKKPDA